MTDVVIISDIQSSLCKRDTAFVRAMDILPRKRVRPKKETSSIVDPNSVEQSIIVNVKKRGRCIMVEYTSPLGGTEV